VGAAMRKYFLMRIVMNLLFIFGHQINRAGWYEYWKYRKDTIFIQSKPMR
jgi:hypothetical protein